MIERLLPTRFLKRRMTSLGRDILSLMNGDGHVWTLHEHTVKHTESGITLWHGNGFYFFNLYEVHKDKLYLSEEEVKHLLNRADRCVLWRAYHDMLAAAAKRNKEQAMTTVSNLAKLAAIKEHK